jgi:hypothetical protein
MQLSNDCRFRVTAEANPYLTVLPLHDMTSAYTNGALQELNAPRLVNETFVNMHILGKQFPAVVISGNVL